MTVLLRNIILTALCVFFTHNSQAELSIEITEGIESAVPIAVVPFSWQGGTAQPPVNVSTIVQSDLGHSGYFKALPVRDMLTRPTNASVIRFRNWKALGQEFLLIGQVSQQGALYSIQFQLFDVYKHEQLMGYRMTAPAKELRNAAHKVSDIVYQKLTGIKGSFGSKIAYITSVTSANKRKVYKLEVADVDGYNPKTIVASVEPIMSPAWSPDGKKIAYVSFEKRKPAVYIQTLATGKRVRISDFNGINGAPAWSPDGKQLALTLSKDGSPDIYKVNLATGAFVKMTRSYAIDTEPGWSPDGRYIIFTSDRGGKPQLYMMPSAGGRVSRLTFEGDYNARGRFSPDGKSIVMVHANRGDYRIAVMDVASKAINILTPGRLDEAPSFSPNGQMVLYASQKRYRGVLSAVSVDGRMHQKLVLSHGDVREPAWGP